ncbi:hypothetical protein C8F04DRAFT_110537 [Mycena alexandri]|uniref:Secreted protein n=1 Tax=Mycena alexandri TaxID=1745969 RepID=A0AAD6T8V6_9AGAR|nr:hypothetical protein C8F04DRAFT_110537 [Mycena alexandri]
MHPKLAGTMCFIGLMITSQRAMVSWDRRRATRFRLHTLCRPENFGHRHLFWIVDLFPGRSNGTFQLGIPSLAGDSRVLVGGLDAHHLLGPTGWTILHLQEISTRATTGRDLGLRCACSGINGRIVTPKLGSGVWCTTPTVERCQKVSGLWGRMGFNSPGPNSHVIFFPLAPRLPAHWHPAFRLSFFRFIHAMCESQPAGIRYSVFQVLPGVSNRIIR